MFENKRFYHASTKKVITAFGTVFNSVKILRGDTDEISVPITYAPTEHFIAALNKELDKPGETINKMLPRMSFVFSSPEYDPTRESDNLDKITKVDDDGAHWQFQPVPYTYTATLNIWTRYLEDHYQIVEQILPYFRPDFSVTINDSASVMGISQDISFELISVDDEDSYENDILGDKRAITSTLQFAVKMYFYPPVESGELVKHVILNIQPSMNTEEPQSREKYEIIVDPWEANEDDVFNLIETWSSVIE